MSAENKMDLKIYQKITAKKEFSQLPKKDVEKAYSCFEKRQVSDEENQRFSVSKTLHRKQKVLDEEKIRLTRELLHKVFGAFSSRKVFSCFINSCIDIVHLPFFVKRISSGDKNVL